MVQEIQVLDIGDVLPDTFDRTGMYKSDGYRRFEKRAVDHLKSVGWKFETEGRVVRPGYKEGECSFIVYHPDEFITTDGDSFGPLVRMLFGVKMPDGTIVDLLHG